EVGLDYIQLHGDETAEFARELSLPVIKAININDTLIFDLNQFPATYFIIDSPGKKHRGGSGETFDWNALTQTNINFSNVFLAGGLNEKNVNLAIQTVSPIGVDVSSGVESNQIKDHLKIKEFIKQAKQDKTFQDEVHYYSSQYVGRETPLYKAEKLTNKLGGAQVYLKREDLNHTGAHKINNAIAQALLAKRMGKKKIVAETGAGQHGVATATVCALLDLDCIIFMGDVDIKDRKSVVFRMELLGAEVRSVSSGSKTLKDAVNEALRYWVANVEDTHYILGSVVGPHPFPMIVRDFQSVIGTEAKQQFKDLTG